MVATIHHPPSLINAYLSEKIDQKFAATYGSQANTTVPFFPSTPTDIDALTQFFPYSDGRFAVYDRLFKMRKSKFPHIKSEQLMYYFYKYGENAIENVMDIAQLVNDYLDNGDESAQEINYWVKTKLGPDGYFHAGDKNIIPVFFHDLKVFQLEETRDIIDFGTARTYAGNKIIINYDYHKNYPGQSADPVRPF